MRTQIFKPGFITTIALFISISLSDLQASELVLNGRRLSVTGDSVLKEVPKCPKPNDPVYYRTDPTTAYLMWDDFGAVPGGLKYEIRYRRSGIMTSWKFHEVTTGNEIVVSGLKAFESYNFEIRKICISEDRQYQLESEWTTFAHKSTRTPSGPECDSLGHIQVMGGSGFDVGMHMLASYYHQIDSQDCNIVFGFYWCDSDNTCYRIYWVSDGSDYIDFSTEFYKKYPSLGHHPYLAEAIAFVACPDTVVLVPGEVYSSGGWDSLEVEITCPDTILFEAPDTMNLNCGDNFSVPTPAQNALASASVGDTFTIGGYPLILTSVSGGSGVFSGTADVGLPWQGLSINVPFTSLEVNQDYQVTGGSIVLESDPNFDPETAGTFEIGGDICIPPAPPVSWDSVGVNSVTGLPWDEFGFGPDSTYIKDPPYPGYDENDPYDPYYDPNGFDYNGIHYLTQTEFNEFGCNRNGLDTLGQPCNPEGSGPYYFLNQNPLGPETQEGIEFANSVKDTLLALITEVLLAMEDKLNDSVDVQREDCDEIRSAMDGLINTLDYNEDFIYGPNDEYFEEGMFEAFQSKPQPFQVTMDRDPNTVLLENKHIALYECDYRLGIYLRFLEFIDEMQTQNGLDDLKALLLEKIKRFSTQQVQLYADFTEFKKWIESEILVELDKEYKNNYGEIIGLNQSEERSIEFNWPNEYTQSEYYASNSQFVSPKFSFHPGDFEQNPNFQIYNQFKRGDLWIGETHRALLLEEISKNNRIQEAMLLSGSVMPIDISLEVLGTVYTIIIDRITLSTSGATLDAFMVITDPGTGQKIVFQGLNIGFSPNGAMGSSELSLASEVSIRLSNAAKLILHNTGDTYVSWDCNGFAGMGVGASIEFCREFLTPLDSVSLEPLPESDTTRVQAHFVVDLPAWGDFIAQVSIDPFAVTKAEHIRWIVEEATLDFSDIKTPDIQFPSVYTSPHVSNGVPSETWKGFHLKQLSATFASQFSDDTSQITIGVEDMIFDDRGFTGELFIQSNIVSLDNGSLGGWPFSIDSLTVSIIANQLMGGGISGYINVPVFEGANDPNPAITTRDCFYYRAELKAGGGFCFTVSTGGNTLKAPLFKTGEVVLLPNSSIGISVNDGEFIAKASLNGSLSISAGLSSSIALDLDTIRFIGFEVSNVEPYFSPGLWSVPASLDINIGGFSASVGDIRLVKADEDDEVAMSIRMKIGFGGPDTSGGIWADARTQVIGKLEVEGNRQKWVYDRFRINEILIDADIKGNHVKGGLLFYEDDPVYYQGFRGVLELSIKSLNVTVLAVAQFGRHQDEYKYFFVDALASFGNGIGAGTFKIMGLGGGLYHHMSRDNSNATAIPSTPTGVPELGNLGESLSNIVYVPNESIGIGFKATIVFATTSEKAFNGNATFELVFNSGGGIAEISIEGNARFMSLVDFGASPSFDENSNSPPLQVPLSAYVRIRYDFNNSILEGDLNVFLNTPTIQGSGPNGQLVWAKLYFSPTSWYINIGTPSNPCGVSLNIPGLGSIAQVTAYIDIGTNIEPMPPLPDRVKELTGAIQPNIMRGSGRGFAFGAAIRISTGELKFLIVRASLEAAAGFDVLVQDYGEATCYHNGQKPGIDGWYAAGQVYAFIEGKVGVKAFGKYIPILELGIAAVLQGRMPNPIWLQGAFGVQYRVLGGLVKGKCKFRFTIGQLCELVQPGDSSVLELQIIQDITPPHMSYGAPTYPEILVSLNYPLGKKVTDLSEENEYLIKYQKAELVWEGNKIHVDSTLEDEGYTLVFRPNYYLPEQDTIYFNITMQVLQNGSVIQTESDTIWFITGISPTTISPSNIVASYPINGQYNFYPKENKAEKGYMILEIGQSYLFIKDEPILYLINPSGLAYSLRYTYDFMGRKIDFELPSEILVPGELYKLAFVRLNNTQAEGSEEKKVNVPGISSPPPVPSYEVATSISDPSLASMDVITQWVFRVSQFPDFKTKIDSLKDNYSAIYSENLGVLTVTPSVSECFSLHEAPNLGYDPLISLQMDFVTFSWYVSNVYPKLYKIWPGEEGASYPKDMAFAQVPYLNRSNFDIGIPPSDAMNIPPPKGRFRAAIDEETFLKGVVETGPMQVFTSTVLMEMRKDWEDVKMQLQNYFLQNPNDYTGPNPDPNAAIVDHVLSNSFPTYTGFSHPLIWEYRLPGTNQLTSSIKMNIIATNN